MDSRYAVPPNILLPAREEPLPVAPPEEYNQYGPNTNMVAVDKAIKEIDNELNKFEEDGYILKYVGGLDHEKKQFDKLTHREKRSIVYGLEARKALLNHYKNNPTEYELKRNNVHRINVLGNPQFNSSLFPERIERTYAMPPWYGGAVRRTKHRSRKSRTKKASRKYRSRNTRSK